MWDKYSLFTDWPYYEVLRIRLIADLCFRSRVVTHLAGTEWPSIAVPALLSFLSLQSALQR